MTAIRELQYAEHIRNVWDRVFKSNDPFEDSFSEEVDSRLLLYPTYGYHLTEEQYHAIVLAAKEIGDKGYYISVVEYAGDFLSNGKHWFCELPEYSKYLQIPLVLENALYSENGIFGMLISHEDHALVGGKREFIAILKKNYPNWENDRITLKEDWEERMANPVLAATS